MKQKKIQFANFPAEGHFGPLTGLAVHLKSLGHDVRWYTGSKFEEYNPAWLSEKYVNEIFLRQDRSSRATFLQMIRKSAEEKVY